MRAKVAISSTRGHEDMSHREKAEQTPHPGHLIVIKTHLPYDLNEKRCAVCLLACVYNPPGICYAAF